MQKKQELDLTPIEEALCTWILQTVRTKANSPITYTNVLMKATYFKNKLKLGDRFYPSRSWIDDFKRRYKVFILSAPRNNHRPAASAFQFFPCFMRAVRSSNLCPSQVYIADEAGLYWRFKSSRTLEPDLITFLTCTNVTGQHKLRPLVIGKIKDPKLFKNIELPIHYYSQKNGWISRKLFTKWFHECFVDEVKLWLKMQNLPQRALLLVDSAACHPTPGDLMTTDNYITVLLMPHQPDQEEKRKVVYDFIKRKYKDSILRTATSPYANVDILTKLNLKDMSFLLSDCWNSVTTDMILSWWHSFDLPDNWMMFEKVADVPNKTEPNPSIQQLCDQFGFDLEKINAWYEGVDEDKIGSHYMTDDEILESSLTITLDGDEDVEDETSSDDLQRTKLSPDEACKGFDLCIRWAEENGYSCSEIALLRNMKARVIKFPSREPPPKRIKRENLEEDTVEIKTELHSDDEEIIIKEEIKTESD